MGKICALVGLISDANFGDVIIYDSCSYLLKKADSSTEIKAVDLVLKRSFSHKLVKRVLNVLGLKELGIKFDSYMLSLSYAKKLKGADYIVVAGGGLIKYKYQNIYTYLTGLIAAAVRLSIPISLNAVGVEGYDENELRCQFLKESLNKDIVKSISTRDDINTLRTKYIYNKNIETLLVPDSAILSAYAYDVEKDDTSDVVGIGLIRGGIFEDNDISFSRSEVLDYYVCLVRELEKRGVKYQFFTNGLVADYELGVEVLARLEGNSQGQSIAVPTSAKHLVEIIASFKGIIAARMHATIVAYSLGVPAVGLVWNNKLTLFGELTQHTERFVKHTEFNAPNQIDSLIDAMNLGENKTRKLELEEIIYRNFKKLTINN